MTLIVVAGAVGAFLSVLWVSHLRRDLRRRGGRSAEWEGLSDHGDLWTSAARCPECHAAGALLSREDDVLWHTCMACGHHHTRQTRG